MKTNIALILLLEGITSCTTTSHVTYTVKNASSFTFTFQLSYDLKDTAIVFHPHEEKKVALFNNLKVKPYNFKKIKVKEFNYKKFLLNLKDENSWKLTFRNKALFNSSTSEYKVEILDTDFI